MTKKRVTEEKPTTDRKKRMTPKQWAEAEALWEAGDFSQAELARKFAITEQTIHIHMKRKGLVRGCKAEEHKAKVKEEVAKAAVDDASVHAARIRETKEEHYKLAAGLAKLAWAEVLQTKKDGAPVSVAMNNLKALDAAMNVISKARIERWAVLGLDKDDGMDPDDLPELLISELTEEQIKELRDRDFSEFDEMDVNQINAGSSDDVEVVEES